MDRPSDVVQREAGAATLPTLPGPIRCGANVGIVVGESPNRQEFVETAMACEEHLLLNPDTGLRRPGDNRVSTTHVTVDESIQIVGAQNRNGKLLSSMTKATSALTAN